MSSSLHPIFKAILDDQPLKNIETAYENLLRSHDWLYEDAPHEQYKRGRAERLTVDKIRSEIDPDFAIWDKIAPVAFKSRLDEHGYRYAPDRAQ